MTEINVYDESAKVISYLAGKNGTTIAEFIADTLDMYLDANQEEFSDYINIRRKKDDEDRFFMHYGLSDVYVEWMYRNFDANCANQIVINRVEAYLLKDIQEGETVEDTFDWIGSECRQYCVDCDDEYFDDTLEFFNTAEPLAVGLTAETLNKLKEVLL